MEIGSDARFAECLSYIGGKFGSPVRKTGDRFKLTLPNNTDKLKLFDAITYQIVTKMKTHYIEQNIQIKNPILIKVLSHYDKKTDLIIAASLVQITPVMLLDGLFDFRLTRLKKRWDEVISLVNDNVKNLICKGLFDELLRFLIQNMDYKINEAHIIVEGSTVLVCNDKLVPFANLDTDIINALIDVAPRQVFIHMDTNLEKSLIVKNIETIFPNCVTIQYANN